MEKAGFEYYLQKREARREEGKAAASVARMGASLKILTKLAQSGGDAKIFDLNAQVGMEIMEFMDAIRKMRDAELIEMTGSASDPDEIGVRITDAGKKVASLVPTL